jgi:hypothetical protein
LAIIEKSKASILRSMRAGRDLLIRHSLNALCGARGWTVTWIANYQVGQGEMASVLVGKLRYLVPRPDLEGSRKSDAH